MKHFYLYLLCALALPLQAQRISRQYRNVSMADALRELNTLQKRYTVNFIYDDLEDFRVTTEVRGKSVPDAIQQIIGFYPIAVTQKGDVLLVECTHKTERHLTGKIIDEQGEAVAFANVLLLSPTDSTVIAGGVSNESGVFVVPYEPAKVLAKISYVGYKTFYRVFTTEQAGTIRLQPETQTLHGVTVKRYRANYKMTGEGMVTTVENTALAHIGSASDVLEHLPLMQKSGNGELTVFGKGVPEIYVNGRKMQNANELKTLKSEDIKQVELITSPGAKYDASVRAVVNIKTIARQGDGFSFDVEGSVAQYAHATNLEGDLLMNYRHGGLDVFDHIYYTQGKYYTFNQMRQDLPLDTLWSQVINNDWVQKEREVENTFGVNYAIDEHNSVGAKYVIDLQPQQYQRLKNTSEVTADGQMYDHITAVGEEDTHSKPSHQFNVYYNGSLGGTSVDLNVDYLYSQHRTQSQTREQSETIGSRVVDAENKLRNRLFATKLILGREWLGGQLDFGAEYTNTHRNDDYLNPQNIVPTSYARLDEQRTSPFVQFKRLVKGVGQFTVGARYEFANFDYYQNGQHVDDQSRRFNNLFPSLSWGFRFGSLQGQLSYTTRTKRPSYRDLSNNVTYANRFLRNSGNPSLQSGYIHDITLQGMYHWLLFSITYTDVRHDIVWDAQLVDNQPITLLTHTNVKTLKTLQPAVVLVPRFGFYSPKLTLAMNKQWFRYQGVDCNKPVFFATFDNDFKFSETLSANILWSFQGKGHYQNVYLDMVRSHLDLSVTKLLCHKQLSIRLAAKDIFRNMKDGNHIYSNGTVYYQSNIYDKRCLTLTVKYSFNSAKSKYKGTGAGNEEKKRL